MKRLNNVNLTFREFDAELNKDGTISKDKLRRILSTLKVVELDIVKLFEICGLQGHVELNYTEFLEWLEDVHGPDFKVTVRPQTVREAPSDLIVPPLDHQELINVVFSSSEGKVDSSQVTVTPNDGNRVGKHFWLSIVGSPSMPTGVALHPRAITPWEKRADGARVMFGEHELAPRRLGVCGDCFVETWEGDTPFCLVDIQAWEDWGALLARIHKLPTEWFDTHRAGIEATMPSVANIPRGSHLWPHLIRNMDCLQHFEEHGLFSSFADRELRNPEHPAASRIVTALCNLHPDNVVGGASLKVVNFERACVTHAVQDLASQVSGPARPETRAFLRRYLEEMGKTATPAEIERLLIDCQLASIVGDPAQEGGLLTPEVLACMAGCGGQFRGDAQVIRLITSGAKAFVTNVRSSPDLQKRLVDEGLLALLRSDPLHTLIQSIHERGTRGLQRSAKWLDAVGRRS